MVCVVHRGSDALRRALHRVPIKTPEPTDDPVCNGYDSLLRRSWPATPSGPMPSLAPVSPSSRTRPRRPSLDAGSRQVPQRSVSTEGQITLPTRSNDNSGTVHHRRPVPRATVLSSDTRQGWGQGSGWNVRRTMQPVQDTTLRECSARSRFTHTTLVLEP